MKRNEPHPLTEIRRADAAAGIPCEHVECWLAESGRGAVPMNGIPVDEMPAEIASHLDECRQCRTEQAEMLKLAIPRAESTPDPLFVRSVMARVRREPAPVRRQRRTALRLRAAALLAVLLLPVSVFLVSTIDHGADPGPVGTTETAHRETHSDSTPAVTMTVRVDQWQSGYDRWRVDAQPNGGWIPAFRGDEGSREVVSF